jgi:hypothetical protein
LKYFTPVALTEAARQFSEAHLMLDGHGTSREL